MLLSASGGIVDGVGQRPHRDVPRPRDPVDCGLRAGRHAPAAPDRSRTRPALKYFVLGAFSSAFFLYGIALVYGGHRVDQPARPSPVRHLARPRGPGWQRGRSGGPTALCRPASPCSSSGFGFKVAAAPFHLWAPDVYQGSLEPESWRSWRRACEGGRLRRHCCGCSSSAFGAYRTDWRPMRVRPRRGHACSCGSVVRGRADRREADAGLLVDQPRRVHPRSAMQAAQRRRRDGRRSSTWPPTRSWWPAVVRRDHAWWAGTGDDRARPRRPSGACRATTPLLALVFSLFLLAQAGVPLTVGLLRQVLRLASCGRSRRPAAGAGGDAVGRDRRIPLPADHRGDVHGVRRRPRRRRGRRRRPRRDRQPAFGAGAGGVAGCGRLGRGARARVGADPAGIALAVAVVFTLVFGASRRSMRPTCSTSTRRRRRRPRPPPPSTTFPFPG